MMRILWVWMCASLALAQMRIIPHVTAPGGGFVTQLHAVNVGDQVEEIRITPYAADGSSMAPVSWSLQPFAGAVLDATDLVGEGASHLAIEASAYARVAASYQLADGRSSPAHAHEQLAQAATWRLFPGNWDVIFDGIAVVNLGSGRADVTLRQVAFDGSTIQSIKIFDDLESMAKGLYVIGAPSGSEFDVQADSYFRVDCTQPVALIALRGTPPGSDVGYLWENATSGPQLPNTPLVLGHLTRADGGFTSEILLQNASNGPATYTIRSFKQDGSELPEVSGTAAAQTTMRLQPADLLGSSDASHFVVERSAAQLEAFVTYANATGTGSPAQVSASRLESTSWFLYAGNWDEVFDGIAVVNGGSRAANIYIQQVSANPVKAERIACERVISDLASHAKGLYVVGSPGGGTPFSATPGFLRVTSLEPISVVPLRGTVPGSPLGILWSNQAQAVPELAVSENPYCDDEDVGIYFKPQSSPYYSRTMDPEQQEVTIEVYNARNESVSGDFDSDSTSPKLNGPFNMSPFETLMLASAFGPEVKEVFISLLFTFAFTQDLVSFGMGVRAGPSATALLVHQLLCYSGTVLGLSFGGLLLNDAQWECLSIIRESINSFGQTGIPFLAWSELDVFLVAPKVNFFAKNLPGYFYGDGNERKSGPDDLFPCGEGPNGLTLCPTMPLEPPVGVEYLIVTNQVRGDIPIQDDAYFKQFGFVFDADGDSGNNWVAAPQFPGDTYQGTDLWYSAEYSPSQGWSFLVTDARNNQIRRIASAARILIADSTITLMVPRSEFATANPKMRMTVYAHTGDFGQNDPWSGDLHPAVGEPLIEIE